LAEVSKDTLRATLASPTSIGHLVQLVAQQLGHFDLFYGHGTDNPDDEAYALVFAVLDISFSDAEAAWENSVSDTDIDGVTDCLYRRIHERIPLPYLTGIAWFAGMPFHVDERALIPRSPIAQLLEKGYSPWLHTEKELQILDMCTGNGCIAIATAAYILDASVDAVDISTSALDLARQNVVMHELSDRVEIIQSDLFSELDGRQYDLIVSNPPYVPHQSMLELPEEYSHEPVMALEADDQGMAIVDKILHQSARYLKENGILIVEVGEIQQAVEDRYNDLPFTWLEFERGGDGVFLLNKADLPV
jgi:ribosomal protein L3 glutamine methyltransferase